MGSHAATRQPPVEARARDLRVVLADDSETVRWLATNVLSRAGITQVSTAVDGPAALALVDAEEPDCIVLDVQMPGMTGFEVLAELRIRVPGAARRDAVRVRRPGAGRSRPRQRRGGLPGQEPSPAAT